METQAITLDRAEARELYRDYKKHLHYSTPIDDEIRRAYQLIAQGRLVIKALESIKAAGLNAQGLPKMAICRAHGERCNLERMTDGRAEFSHLQWHNWTNKFDVIRLPEGSFQYPTKAGWLPRAQSIVPQVPLKYRPKRGLQNYHVLWEAEWTPIPTRDPYLLRRIGKGDMWLVVAMWDLTEVERSALAARALS